MTENVKELASAKRECEQGTKRIAELDRLISRIYEDNVSGKITDERFAKMLGNFENEQSDLAVRVKHLECNIAEVQSRSTNTEQFLRLVHKYTDTTELNVEILREFVEKIVVHKCELKRGQRYSKDAPPQEIQIFYNCIGEIALPDGYAEK